MSDDGGGLSEYIAANRLDLLVEIAGGVQAALGCRFWEQMNIDYPEVGGPEKMVGYAGTIAAVSKAVLLALAGTAELPCPECGGPVGCLKAARGHAEELLGVLARNQVYLDEKDEAVISSIRRWLA